jgi:hypothetical protein
MPQIVRTIVSGARIGCMAELEVHTEHEAHDSFGKLIGVVASLIGVMLAIVTIISHRAHTDAVLLKAEANDKWSYYESKRIKFHSLELGEDLMNVLDAKGDTAEKVKARYASEKKRYEKEGDEAQSDAKKTDTDSAEVETRALRYDFGEGLLEVGLILTSLYFISKSKLLPAAGVSFALIGIGLAVSGYFV